MREQGATEKWTVVSLVWVAMVASHVIRVALGVVAPTLMTMYGISPQVMGYVLSGWNWAYVLALPAAGPLVDRFGPWIMMGIGAGGWGLATMALPIASTAVSLFAMRALFGATHSMLVPSNASAISRFFRPEQRATAVGITFSGNQVGLAIGTTVVAYILTRFGWQAVFYCIGGASMALAVLWLVVYPDKRIGRQVAPLQHQNQSDERVPWRALLCFRDTWGIFFGQMGYLYSYFFFMSWLPGYLVMERKMSMLRTGIYGSLPFWAGMVGTLGGGWLGDYLIRRGVSRTTSRKSIIGTGLTLATILVITAAYTPQTWLAVLLLTLCMGSLRMVTASVNSTPIDLAPPAAVASLTSIQNVGGSTGGLLAPIVTGYIVGSTGSFVGALIVAGGMALFGAVCYVFGPRSLEEPLKIKR
ncbi:MAG: MFS transporter [Acidobacteria bacterium]|nr:MFS transporter [Acidobacteriota bacterium]